MSTGVVLLACGSFNPITRMHLAMFQMAKSYFERNEIKFIKGLISPVHDSYFIKKGKLVTAAFRTEMINLAIDEFNKANNISDSYLLCDQWETVQAGWTRTIDVLNHVKEMIKSGFFADTEKLAKIELRLLCGADLLYSMTNKEVWNEEDIQKIIEGFGLFVHTRSGFQAQTIIDEHPVLKKYASNIILNENTFGYEDSSTKVRQAVREGREPTDLIHRSVYDYIVKNELYR